MHAKLSGGLVALALLSVLAIVVNGCGQKVEMRVVDPMGKTTPSEREKINQHLEAAGIKGEIYSVVDDDKQWIVDVGAPKPPPGKRAAPTMPITYLVDKASGKVSTTGMQ